MATWIKTCYNEVCSTIISTLLDPFSRMLLFNYIEKYVALSSFVASLTGYLTYMQIIVTAYKYDLTHIFDDKVIFCDTFNSTVISVYDPQDTVFEDTPDETLCISESYAFNLVCGFTAGSFVLVSVVSMYEHQVIFHPPDLISFGMYHQNLIK